MTWCRGNNPPRGRRGVLPDRRRRSRAYTLIELLTVVSIIALVGGLGAGAFHLARRNYSLQASAGRIQGVLRAARNSALSSGNPTFAIVDPVSRRVSAQAFERVGEWSFEESDSPEEAPGVPGAGSNHGGVSIPGRVGRGLSFQGKDAYFDCGSEPRFDLRTGIVATAWIRRGGAAGSDALSAAGSSKPGKRARPSRAPPAAAGSAAILAKPGAYSFGITPAGALVGEIGAFRVVTDAGVVPPERWAHVEMLFDGRRIQLAVDGVPRQALPEGARTRGRNEALPPVPETAPVTAAPLTISSQQAPFPGAIDEVRLAGATEPLEYVWPEHERVLGWKKVIRFDRRGHLDSAFHTGGVRMMLVEVPDDPPVAAGSTAVAVDYTVTFDEWRSRLEKPESADLAAEEAKLEAAHAASRQAVITVDRLGVVH